MRFLATTLCCLLHSLHRLKPPLLGSALPDHDLHHHVYLLKRAAAQRERLDAVSWAAAV